MDASLFIRQKRQPLGNIGHYPSHVRQGSVTCDGSFGRGTLLVLPYSPRWGCAVRPASFPAKISRRSGEGGGLPLSPGWTRNIVTRAVNIGHCGWLTRNKRGNKALQEA